MASRSLRSRRSAGPSDPSHEDVSRPSAAPADARAAHRKRMRERQERQLARTPGFTPVKNARIDKAIMAAMLALRMQGKSAMEAEDEARRHVARQLPAPNRSKLYRPRPSKSDSAEYRKPFVRDRNPGKGQLA